VAKKSPSKTKAPAPVELTGLELYFSKFAASHQNPVNKIIHIIFIPLIIFGLFAICWSLKFPYIKFLGKYNQDFNWSSFLLAFVVYYYMRLSPVLAYFMLFILLGFFYIITELVQWQTAAGPNMGIIALVIYFVSFIALFAGYELEGKKLSWEYRMKNVMTAPIFLLHLVLRRFKIKY